MLVTAIMEDTMEKQQSYPQTGFTTGEGEGLLIINAILIILFTSYIQIRREVTKE